MLKIGDTAPDFCLPNQKGEMVTLDDLVSRRPAIIYFYPADFTPVCTREACAFRDHYKGLSDLSVSLVGISPQSVGSHKRFSEAFSLPFPLLADEKKAVIRAFGVDGPLGFGVRRTTFLIDRSKSVINRVVSDFFVGGHLDLVRKVLETR
jgi:peroxiredoxin Q/BCP